MQNIVHQPCFFIKNQSSNYIAAIKFRHTRLPNKGRLKIWRIQVKNKTSRLPYPTLRQTNSKPLQTDSPNRPALRLPKPDKKTIIRNLSSRSVAQSGSALAWGARGRRFESFHSDQKFNSPVIFDRAVYLSLPISNFIFQAFQPIKRSSENLESEFSDDLLPFLQLISPLSSARERQIPDAGRRGRCCWWSWFCPGSRKVWRRTDRCTQRVSKRCSAGYGPCRW